MKTFVDTINESYPEYLSSSFKLSEFACKNGDPFTPKVLANLKVLASYLEIIRSEYSKFCGYEVKINITSGYRSPKYNAWLREKHGIGTAKNSQHMQGKAADLYPSNGKTKELYNFIIQLAKNKKIPYGYIHYYPPKQKNGKTTNNFVHYDYVPRGTKSKELEDNEENYENKFIIPVMTKLDAEEDVIEYEKEMKQIQPPTVNSVPAQSIKPTTIFDPSKLSDFVVDIDIKNFKG